MSFSQHLRCVALYYDSVEVVRCTGWEVRAWALTLGHVT